MTISVNVNTFNYFYKTVSKVKYLLGIKTRQNLNCLLLNIGLKLFTVYTQKTYKTALNNKLPILMKHFHRDS